jgi:hypothetical protein
MKAMSWPVRDVALAHSYCVVSWRVTRDFISTCWLLMAALSTSIASDHALERSATTIV